MADLRRCCDEIRNLVDALRRNACVHAANTVLYDLPTVILSLLAAVFASAVALYGVSRQAVTAVDAAFGSISMGGAILAMHYIGMAAMRIPAMCRYDPALLATSGVIAIGGSLVALWLTFRFRTPVSAVSNSKIASAIAMGIAIAAMHYAGMAAARFYPSCHRLSMHLL